MTQPFQCTLRCCYFSLLFFYLWLLSIQSPYVWRRSKMQIRRETHLRRRCACKHICVLYSECCTRSWQRNGFISISSKLKRKPVKCFLIFNWKLVRGEEFFRLKTTFFWTSFSSSFRICLLNLIFFEYRRPYCTAIQALSSNR